MIDWKDPKRTDVIHFKMIDPNNLDQVFGDIDLVQLGSSNITYGYYADTRYQSQITLLRESNYVDNMWIRIVHEVPAENYVNELGTFIPISPVINYTGTVTKSFDLQSPLWSLTDDYTSAAFTIAAKSSYLDAFKKVCDTCHRSYLMENPTDYKPTKAVVYEIGTSYMDILFDIADATNNRIDVDGHGRITLSPLVDKTTLSPTWELDVDDPRSMIVQGSVKMEAGSDERPNRTIVINNNIVGVADLPDGVEFSAAQRGYIKAQTYSVSSVKNKTQAQSLAQQYLDGFSRNTQWTMETLYFPAKCGENLTFIIEGKKHLCFIQNIDPVNLNTMTMKLTLKEVS